MQFSDMGVRIEIAHDIKGSILDIGGGGECVIGQIFKDQVIAIDNLQEELDEAPNCCEKRLMDATELKFPDNSFDNVTFFYSLMYMNHETQRKAIKEAFRVLKPGGMCYIWDTAIDVTYPNTFIVDLDIVADKLSVHTSYGISKADKQDAETIFEILSDAGFRQRSYGVNGEQFFITCDKSQDT